MTESTPDEPLAKLLANYEALGGVIQHVLISPGTSGQPSAAYHRAAALFTFDVLARRLDAYFENLLQHPDYRGRHRNDFFTIRVNADLLTGRPISPNEFVGPRWDRRQRQLTGSHEMTGYAYAFFDPPYNLYDHGPARGYRAAQAADLFCALTDSLFGGFPDSLVIYEWSADCSNYFDDGREWWGTFFWTVEVPGSGRLVGVVASSTD